jgi:hypothetical protein
MITIENLRDQADRAYPATDILALVGAALCERLDEHNRLQEAHTELLRKTGDAAVTREAGVVEDSVSVGREQLQPFRPSLDRLKVQEEIEARKRQVRSEDK